MARLVLVALVWSVVQGEEYGGGGMPHYGGVAADYAEPAAAASADYTGHSPDAPALLDYKYIEDKHGSRDKFQKDVDDTNEWEQRPKERRSRHDNDELDMVDSETAVLKHKPSRRSRHRSRLKSEKTREPRRRRNRNNRGNEDNDDVRREYMQNNHYRDEMKSEVLDEEHIQIKETTERIIRRKARDRHFAPPPSKSVDLESEDEIINPVRKSPGKRIDTETEDEIIGSVQKMKDDDDKFEPDYNINQNRRHGHGRPIPPSFDMDDDDEIDRDIDLKKKSASKRKFDKNYPDYNSYYDMKRVNNIKNRLPMLLRRTTTTIPSLEEDTTSDILKMLWTARRAASPRIITPRATTTTTTTITNTTTITLSRVVMPIKLSSTTKSPLSAASLEFTDFLTTKEELSLAERSRLSILKKAHRKESDKPAPSTKPPVLLHITNKLPTVVMVEPPPGDDPWMRAKEISNDSPERLEKVKRLMRQKLVADAKNIKDLTDNWDEMVCDYIDTSILDSQGCNRKVESWLLFVCCCIYYLISKK